MDSYSSADLTLWAKNVLDSLNTNGLYHPIENHTLDSIQNEIAEILAIERIEGSRGDSEVQRTMLELLN